LLIIALLLFQGGFAYYEEEPSGPVEVSFSWGPIWEAVSSVTNSIGGIPQAITDAFFNSFKEIVSAFTLPLLALIREFLLFNIEPLHFEKLWLLVVSVISLCYMVLFLVVGLKFLLGSYDAGQRASAKEWLKGAIVIVVAVNASLLLYSLALSLSSAIASYLWSSELDALLVNADLSPLNLLWVIMYASSAFFALITLFLRQVLLVAGVMLFPVGLFFYFIPPLRPYGYCVLSVLGVTGFMQVIDVIVLVAVNLVIAEFSSAELIGALGVALGLTAIAIVNSALFLMALFSVIGAIAKEHPALVTVVKSAAGVVIAGGL